MHLTQKERTLLEDLKSHEQICIKKYTNYANQAQDPQLKQLFQDNAKKEQEHYNSIDQILQNNIPNVQQQGQQQQQQASQPNIGQTGMVNQADADLCQDMLSTEKYVSGTYDTVIFEMRDPKIRQVLNHIQSEEQKHGEALFAYMQSKGMYKVH